MDQRCSYSDFPLSFTHILGQARHSTSDLDFEVLLYKGRGSVCIFTFVQILPIFAYNR